MGASSRIRRLLAAVCLAVGMTATAVQAAATVEIVGGERANIADYPYAVYLATSDGFQFCGGTLAASDKVITAAHCAKGQRPANVFVVGGREDKLSTTTGVSVPVKSIWIHPEYTDALIGDDVAVLTLGKRLPYRPIAFARPQQEALYEANTRAMILGWGRTESGGQTSRFLLKAEVPVVSDADCKRSFSKYNPDAMVCSGYPQGGKDGCQGDSGGPMVAGGYLIGISSWGEGCGLPDKPGVYTRVAAYAQELAQQIRPTPVP